MAVEIKHDDECKHGWPLHVDDTCPKCDREEMRNNVLAWLGRWRDGIRTEAVSSLQDILGVPK